MQKSFVNGPRVAAGTWTSTLFWEHKWVVDRTLKDLAIHDIPVEISGATVANMWDSESGWKWDTFANYLPPMIPQHIDAYILKEDPSIVDLIY